MRKILFIFTFFLSAAMFSAILPYPLLSNHTNITESDAYKINNHFESEISQNSVEEQAVLDLDFLVIDKLLPVGSTFELCDLNSNQIFSFVRVGGKNHADIQPATEEDASLFCQFVELSWQRRPVVVKLNDNAFLPASLAPYPHGYNQTDTMSGHLCLHFQGSKTDGTQEEDFQHQKNVRLAKQRSNEALTLFQ